MHVKFGKFGKRQTSNLACRFITRGPNKRNAELGQRVRKGHVAHFWYMWPPPYLTNGWS